MLEEAITNINVNCYRQKNRKMEIIKVWCIAFAFLIFGTFIFYKMFRKR